MPDRRPTCHTVDVGGVPVRVHGVGPPTPADLAVLAEAVAFLRIAGHRPPGEPLSATCGSCDAAIVWALLPSGKRMPLDATPAPDGNIAARRDANGDLHARVLKAGDEPADGERRGTSHFSTCPNAAAHRRKRT